MFAQNIALAALIAAAAASTEEAAYSCPKFKEFVEDNHYDCGSDFETCKNTERCDIYVCDGSSDTEKAMSQGGYLYELSCGRYAEYDTWEKICELEKVLHPYDKNSAIYIAACHDRGTYFGCSATLELHDTLTYEWELSCSNQSGFV